MIPSVSISTSHRVLASSRAILDEPSRLVSLWEETSEAVLRVAAPRHESEHILTQGLILAVPSFLATLAVEAVIHRLDMTVQLAGAVPPTDETLQLARETLDGLLGTEAPADWDDSEYLLKGTGRTGLSERDRTMLGEYANRFPLFS